MATRSTIAIKREDGSFVQTYCHFDGYPQHNGRILQEAYGTVDRVESLLALGDLSLLKPLLEPTDGAPHSFGKPVPGVCVAYGRDRGETGVGPNRFEDAAHFTQRRTLEEYNYLFVDGAWSVNGEPLTLVLAGEREV
jgi:hypothetical protein